MVRRIFQLRAEGVGQVRIAKTWPPPARNSRRL
jgi:hypothetical protein